LQKNKGYIHLLPLNGNYKVVGYLKVNFGQAQTEFRHDGWFEIERIYVVQEFWGKSIGQALLDFAIALAAKQACSCVWLGVWERNFRAIRFYEKNGFLPFDKHIFQVGDDPQWDLLLKKEICEIIYLKYTRVYFYNYFYRTIRCI
jgi:diamine N-acetyltransferase